MGNQNSYQDKYLKTLMEKELEVVIYLVNGVRLTGTISKFDNFIIIADTTKGQQMVYKHAVSTLVPEEEIEL